MNRSGVPRFGDYVWMDFDHQAGHEQKGRRPALVLSQEGFNRVAGVAYVCPITSRDKGFPFHIKIPDGEPVSGFILADHLKSLDYRARKIEFAGQASSAMLQRVLDTCHTIMEG